MDRVSSMTDGLLKTKLHVPITPARLVARARLNGSVGVRNYRSTVANQCACRVRKDNLVCDFIRQIDRPVAWISRYSGDDNLSKFLRYVVAALTGIKVKISEALKSLIEAPQ